MLSASTGLQFLILWLRLDQTSQNSGERQGIKKEVIKGFNIIFANKTECPICI